MESIVFWVIIIIVSVLSALLFWGMSNNRGQSIMMFFVSAALMFVGLFWFLPAFDLHREPVIIIAVCVFVLIISFSAGGLQSFADCNNRRVHKVRAR